jgi:hypothetical protein
VNFLSPFSLSIYAIVALALFGLPIVLNDRVRSCLDGTDLSTAAEQIMNRLLKSYVLPRCLVPVLGRYEPGKMTDHLPLATCWSAD